MIEDLDFSPHWEDGQDPQPEELGPVLVSKAEMSGTQADLQDNSNASVSSVSSLLIHTRPPTPTSPESGEEAVEGDNTPATIHTVTRTLKRPQVVYLRPAAPGTQTLKVPSARIVSLPETVSKYSAKQESSRRVVSMPGNSPVISSAHSEQFHIDGSPARVRVRSIATDLPHTPSPPSSPDSVVFIANRSPLPDGFLRKNTRLQEVHTPEPLEPQDCAPWGSPPRPIPALHGPLSLPYARCPSGAEGTIIEEQENLPRMIWGLEGEHTAHRRRAENDPVEKQHVAQAQSKRTNRPAALQPVSSQFNGQFSRKDDESTAPVPITPSIQDQLLTPEIEPQMLPSQLEIKTGSPEYYYGLSARSPIDLGELMRPRTELPSDLYTKDLSFANNGAWGSTGDGLSGYGSSGDSSWQSILLAQQRLKNALPTFPGGILGNHPRTSASVDSLASLSASSPNILDPQVPASRSMASLRSPFVSQYATPVPNNTSNSHGAPQRLSALEIAQQFRQQQHEPQTQKQRVLPTPPSSSSPIWSSQFSPYQESLLSPELLAAARMPGVSLRDVEVQRLALLQQAEVLRQLHSRLGVSNRDPQGPTSHLASATQLHDHLNDILDPPLAGNAVHRTSLGGLYLQPQQPAVSNPLPIMNPRRSPIGPPLPTSTGFGAIGSRVPPRTPALGSSVPTTPALSPALSQQRARTISQQGPRSIPLARLAQRLSSVPEEEPTVLPERTRPAPAVADYGSGGATQRGQTEKKALPSVRAFNPSNEVGKTRKKPGAGASVPTGRPGSRGRAGSEASRGATDSKNLSAPQETAIANKKPAGVNDTEEGNAPREPSPGRGRRTNNRGRGGGRGGWRARKTNAVNGPERSEGGLTVRS